MSNQVFYESTPNPQAMKFVITKKIADETAFFDDPQKALRSPLASKLFGFPWAQAVMIGPNFVTITKQEWVEWNILADPLASLIDEHLERGEEVLLAENTIVEGSDDSPVVQKIKHILNTEIRPAVAMDGGDIVFHKYENNIVYLYMQGSCAGCPSSTMTLKQGIEVRLKEALPEISEVVAL
jgi:Fe-S cluster biogenesis protein NfuA